MITDTYIVNYLLQVTSSDTIFWQRNDDGLCYTSIYENTEKQIDICIYPFQTRGCGEMFQIKFVSSELRKLGKFDYTTISEPQTKGFGRKYKTEEEKQLASLLKQLYKSALNQCIKREISGQQNEDLLKQKIYKQILSGKN